MKKIDITLLVTPTLTSTAQENLCNLTAVLDGKPLLALRRCSGEQSSERQAQGRLYATFKAHTYPMNFSDMTGLPCRVVAEIL